MGTSPKLPEPPKKIYTDRKYKVGDRVLVKGPASFTSAWNNQIVTISSLDTQMFYETRRADGFHGTIQEKFLFDANGLSRMMKLCSK